MSKWTIEAHLPQNPFDSVGVGDGDSQRVVDLRCCWLIVSRCNADTKWLDKTKFSPLSCCNNPDQSGTPDPLYGVVVVNRKLPKYLGQNYLLAQHIICRVSGRPSVGVSPLEWSRSSKACAYNDSRAIQRIVTRWTVQDRKTMAATKTLMMMRRYKNYQLQDKQADGSRSGGWIWKASSQHNTAEREFSKMAIWTKLMAKTMMRKVTVELSVEERLWLRRPGSLIQETYECVPLML